MTRDRTIIRVFHKGKTIADLWQDSRDMQWYFTCPGFSNSDTVHPTKEAAFEVLLGGLANIREELVIAEVGIRAVWPHTWTD